MGYLASLFQAPPSITGAQNLQTSQYGGGINGSLGNLGSVNAGQQNLEAMQLAEANGGGPNPAQQQFQNNLQQTQQAGASAIASQQGLNPGLAARQIQGATMASDQAAAGQAALLREQQQLAAQQQLGTTLEQQGAVQNQQLATTSGAQNAQNAGQIQNAIGIQGLQQSQYATNVGAATALVGDIASAGGAAAMPGSHKAHGGEVTVVEGDMRPEFVEALTKATGLHDGMPDVERLGDILHAFHAGMAAGGKLSAADRHALPRSDFALGGERYPIPDISHGRNALARVAQHGTESEKKRVSAAVHRKFPSIGRADGGSVPDAKRAVLAAMSRGASERGYYPQPGDPRFVGPVMRPEVMSGERPTVALTPEESAALRPRVFEGGGMVPGVPRVPGDSAKNDIVPAIERAGTVIVPRSVMSKPNAPDAAARFVGRIPNRGRAGPMTPVRLSPGEGAVPPEVARDPKKVKAFIAALEQAIRAQNVMRRPGAMALR